MWRYIPHSQCSLQKTRRLLYTGRRFDYSPTPSHSQFSFCRFIVGFCGSVSSFGGLVDETMILLHGKTWKRKYNAFRNVFYNFFVCLSVYLALIFIIRFPVLLRFWNPATSSFYCTGGTFLRCIVQ